MKSLMTKLALPLTLALGLISNAFAADIDYPQTGPIFVESAYLVGTTGGGGEVDTFYFTNTIAGTYHFYSLGAVDTYGYIYSDTYSTTSASNDDGVAFAAGFCVEAYLEAGEDITVYVEGWSSSSEGDYTVVGSAGSCADSGFFFSDSGVAAPVTASNNAVPDSGAFSLPVILFTILGLGAVRLRRFFA